MREIPNKKLGKDLPPGKDQSAVKEVNRGWGHREIPKKKLGKAFIPSQISKYSNRNNTDFCNESKADFSFEPIPLNCNFAHSTENVF